MVLYIVPYVVHCCAHSRNAQKIRSRGAQFWLFLTKPYTKIPVQRYSLHTLYVIILPVDFNITRRFITIITDRLLYYLTIYLKLHMLGHHKRSGRLHHRFRKKTYSATLRVNCQMFISLVICRSTDLNPALHKK